jgi:hypothetical protein
MAVFNMPYLMHHICTINIDLNKFKDFPIAILVQRVTAPCLGTLFPNLSGFHEGLRTILCQDVDFTFLNGVQGWNP